MFERFTDRVRRALVLAQEEARPDYDSDPQRSRSFQVGWQQDVHAPVATRLMVAGFEPVLDIGCGIGRFAAALGGHLRWIGLDESPRQLADCPHNPAIRADARHLPVAEGVAGAVTMLWMLHHLDDPRLALLEARRVLQPGGLLAACTASRFDDQELVPQGYPPTTFDAEEAPDLVADVFGASNIEVEHWDEPLVPLNTREEVAAYARSHLLPPTVAEAVDPPLTLTKRGCLVWARCP